MLMSKGIRDPNDLQTIALKLLLVGTARSNSLPEKPSPIRLVDPWFYPSAREFSTRWLLPTQTNRGRFERRDFVRHSRSRSTACHTLMHSKP